MGKITVVVPYPELRQVVEETFGEQNDRGWEVDVILATGVRPIIERRDLQTDVLIARGVTAAALKEIMGDMPVVDLPISGYDILRAIKVCQVKFGARRIGIVGSRDMVYGAKSIEDFMEVELSVIPVRDEADAEPAIVKLKQDKIDAVIGGVMSTLIAERLGLNAVFIQTGREAIYHALREAKRVAAIRRLEQERTEQFRAILDYSAEGIIAVDGAGNVNLVNLAAVKLANVREDVIGLPAQHHLPQELGLSRVLELGQAELGEIAQINGQQVAVNRVPIKIGRQTAGAVVTFQPVAAIQELEGKIRRKIYQRGHVARRMFKDILGTSSSIKHTIAIAQEFSKVSSNVLITGETGTGKEVFAQSIHLASSRRNGPFVAVNCAALPENLLESELFGYAEGAFTGAAKGGKIGLFELAHMGTIFLDEISEISPKLQGRLLRVLQEQEIMRLGDDRVIPINVRVISATNRDLYSIMKQGIFRQDLYYRVDVLRLVLPTLRERSEDIAILMDFFLNGYCARFNKPLKEIHPDAQHLLEQYEWPGNIRELRNIAERLAVLGNERMIGVQDIEAVLPERGFAARDQGAAKASVRHNRTGNANDAIILRVLEETNYHYAKAAAKLGMSRTTLWRRLKQTELQIDNKF